MVVVGVGAAAVVDGAAAAGWWPDCWLVANSLDCPIVFVCVRRAGAWLSHLQRLVWWSALAVDCERCAVAAAVVVAAGVFALATD